jgi:hypothetical protein
VLNRPRAVGHADQFTIEEVDRYILALICGKRGKCALALAAATAAEATAATTVAASAAAALAGFSITSRIVANVVNWGREHRRGL